MQSRLLPGQTAPLLHGVLCLAQDALRSVEAAGLTGCGAQVVFGGEDGLEPVSWRIRANLKAERHRHFGVGDAAVALQAGHVALGLLRLLPLIAELLARLTQLG